MIVKRSTLRRLLPSSSSNAWVGVCAALAIPAAANAQQVIAPPPPEFTARPPVDPLAGPGAEAQPDAITSALGAGEGALQWVVTHLHPHILYRFLYGDGIQALPGVQVKTAIHELYPGVSLNIGKQLNVAYTPVIRVYSSEALEDTFDQAVSLGWHTIYRDWSFALNSNYSLTSQPLVETGAQTETESIATGANAVWAMNQSMALELGLMHNLQLLSGEVEGQRLNDYQTFSTMDWLNYTFAPGLSAAIGVGGGYDDVSAGTDMTFEQVRARVSWRVQRRLNLVASGGAESRQFLDSEAQDNIAPVYSGSAVYQLFEPTRVFVSGAHTISPSYFADELSEATEVSAGIQQRLFGKLVLNLSAGYRLTSYATTAGNLQVTREDESTFVNGRLSTVLFKRASIALLYQWSENTSDEAQYQYHSNQIGFEIGYRF